MTKKKIIIAILLVCCGIFFYLQYQVVHLQNTDIPVPSDCIFILGHSIDENNVPSDWLTKRLETGLALYQNGYAPMIVVTGGKGPVDNISVADAMKEWLLQNQVAPDGILVEDQSKNTFENFKFSKSIAEQHEIRSIIVVSNDFHMYRSMQIANDFFDEVSGQSAAVDFSCNKFLAYIKEPLSLLKFYLVQKMTEPLSI